MTRKIIVKRHYRGADTNEQLIPAGEYEWDAPALMGVGQTIVDIGLGVIVEAEEAPEEVEAEEAPKRRTSRKSE